MALITSKPSIPVLQSDTFEIQRQKINNLAADINTRLDTPAGTGIGYTYIKSIKFNYSVGGETHGGHIRYTKNDHDHDSYMFNHFGSLDNYESYHVHFNNVYGMFTSIDAVSPAQYSLEYNTSEHHYVQSSSGMTTLANPVIVSKVETLNIVPAQIATFFFSGTTTHDNWHIGGAYLDGDRSIKEDVALADDKFIVQFALIDGRIATHTYKYKQHMREIDRGGVAGFDAKIILVINAARAINGKHAVRLLQRKYKTLPAPRTELYWTTDYDNPLPLLEDDFTITYS